MRSEKVRLKERQKVKATDWQKGWGMQKVKQKEINLDLRLRIDRLKEMSWEMRTDWVKRMGREMAMHLVKDWQKEKPMD